MFLNMGVLVLVFFGLGLALVGVDRRMGRNNATAKA
jgi:TctA family transporter